GAAASREHEHIREWGAFRCPVQLALEAKLFEPAHERRDRPVVTPPAPAVHTEPTREPLAEASEGAAGARYSVDFTDQNPTRSEPIRDYRQELVLFGQGQIMQDIEQQHAVEIGGGNLEKVTQLELGRALSG